MVKTFVFRVVNKKALTFESEGSYFIYAESKRKAKKQSKHIIDKEQWKVISITEK